MFRRRRPETFRPFPHPSKGKTGIEDGDGPISRNPFSRAPSSRKSSRFFLPDLRVLFTFACLALALPVSGADPATPGEEARIVVPVGQSRLLEIGYGVESVFMAQPEIADIQLVSEGAAFIFGKVPGLTSLALIDIEGRLIQERLVQTVLPLDPIRSALGEGEETRRVSVRERSRGVELGGSVPSAATAERALEIARATLPDGVSLINNLQVAGAQQVNLEVQIAEVQRGVSESLGFAWQILSESDNGRLGLAVGREFLLSPDSDFTFLRRLADGRPAATVGGYRQQSSTRIAGLVDALANAGLASILARPNLTAVSGETASFFSGGEYPLPSGYDDGQITFEFKKFGVLLDFVPTVVDRNRISLTVRPEVSARSETQAITVFGIEIPVIEVRRAETTIEVADGEPFVIAGLYRNQSDSSDSGLPGLKDLPVAGVLFGNRTMRADSTELLIVVTARLVEYPVTTAALRRQNRLGSVRTSDGFHF